MKALIIPAWHNVKPDHLVNVTDGLKRGVEARGVEAIIPPLTTGMSVTQAVDIMTDTVLTELQPGDVILYHGIADPILMRLVAAIYKLLSYVQEYERAIDKQFIVMPYTTFTSQTAEQWELLQRNEIMYSGIAALFEHGDTVDEEEAEKMFMEGKVTND